MNITAIQIARWMQTDRDRQRRMERRQQLYDRIRRVCAFVLGVTAIVLAISYRQELQNFASEKLGKAVNRTGNSPQPRQGADNYEKQVDQVTR